MIEAQLTIFLFGLPFASFFLLVGERLVKGEQFTGRSYCDHCGHELSLIDVFPVFGYLINKGRCHYCKEKIKIRYVIIELLGALAYALGFAQFSWSVEYILYVILVSILLIDTGSDFAKYWVMDRFWIIGSLLYFFYHIYTGNLLEHAISSATLFLLLYGFAKIGEKIWSKIVLGGADIKLFVLIGMVVPLVEGFLVLFLASLFGLIYGMIKHSNKQSRLPFVPFLSLATVLVVLYGNQLIEWYISLWKVFG